MAGTTPDKQTAIVTGASAGIGAVYAQRLAARGFNLILVARRGDRLLKQCEALSRQFGIAAEALVADLANPVDLKRVEDRLHSDPSITMLVNNAGIAKLGPIAETTAAEASQMVALNVTALMQLTGAAVAGFGSRGTGTIVNVASVLSIHALAISSIYSGTKAFVLNYSRGLQQELAGTGVRLQLVLPASTSTELWDLSGIPLKSLREGTVMSAEDMVDAALAGLDQGESITLPSLHDAALWEKYDAARSAAFGATQTGEPAPRYRA